MRKEVQNLNPVTELATVTVLVLNELADFDKHRPNGDGLHMASQELFESGKITQEQLDLFRSSIQGPLDSYRSPYTIEFGMTAQDYVTGDWSKVEKGIAIAKTKAKMAAKLVKPKADVTITRQFNDEDVEEVGKYELFRAVEDYIYEMDLEECGTSDFYAIADQLGYTISGDYDVSDFYDEFVEN